MEAETLCGLDPENIDSPCDITSDPALLTAMESERDRHLLLKLETDFEDFLISELPTLDLPVMSSYQRLLAHRTCDAFNLGHITVEVPAPAATWNSSGERNRVTNPAFVRVTKTADAKRPSTCFSDLAASPPITACVSEEEKEKDQPKVLGIMKRPMGRQHHSRFLAGIPPPPKPVVASDGEDTDNNAQCGDSDLRVGRILSRPCADDADLSDTQYGQEGSGPSPRTMEQREEAYKLARDRIFGDESDYSTGTSPTTAESCAVVVVEAGPSVVCTASTSPTASAPPSWAASPVSPGLPVSPSMGSTSSPSSSSAAGTMTPEGSSSTPTAGPSNLVSTGGFPSHRSRATLRGMLDPDEIHEYTRAHHRHHHPGRPQMPPQPQHHQPFHPHPGQQQQQQQHHQMQMHRQHRVHSMDNSLGGGGVGMRGGLGLGPQHGFGMGNPFMNGPPTGAVPANAQLVAAATAASLAVLAQQQGGSGPMNRGNMSQMFQQPMAGMLGHHNQLQHPHQHQQQQQQQHLHKQQQQHQQQLGAVGSFPTSYLIQPQQPLQQQQQQQQQQAHSNHPQNQAQHRGAVQASAANAIANTAPSTASSTNTVPVHAFPGVVGQSNNNNNALSQAAVANLWAPPTPEMLSSVGMGLAQQMSSAVGANTATHNSHSSSALSGGSSVPYNSNGTTFFNLDAQLQHTFDQNRSAWPPLSHISQQGFNDSKQHHGASLQDERDAEALNDSEFLTTDLGARENNLVAVEGSIIGQ